MKIGPVELSRSGPLVGDLREYSWDGEPTVMAAAYGSGDLGEVVETSLGAVEDDRLAVTIPFLPALRAGWGIETDDGRGFRVESFGERGRRRWHDVEAVAQ